MMKYSMGLPPVRYMECPRTALTTVNVRLVDHVAVGDSETVSFAERGWL